MAQNISNMPHTASRSGWKGVTGGTRNFWRTTRQGARAPHVFSLINDINRNISGTIKLFADDALLFHQIRSDADCVSLQKDLEPYTHGLGSGACNVMPVGLNSTHYKSQERSALMTTL